MGTNHVIACLSFCDLILEPLFRAGLQMCVGKGANLSKTADALRSREGSSFLPPDMVRSDVQELGVNPAFSPKSSYATNNRPWTPKPKPHGLIQSSLNGPLVCEPRLWDSSQLHGKRKPGPKLPWRGVRQSGPGAGHEACLGNGPETPDVREEIWYMSLARPWSRYAYDGPKSEVA